MSRNKLFILSLISLAVGMLLVASCGGGGSGGGSSIAPIMLASVDNAGTEGNDESLYPAVSSDGRYVAFESYASNLVAGDTNSTSDIFVRDTTSGITSRVSVSTASTEGNGFSYNAAINSSGRYVAFESESTNLVANDSNGFMDVFVRDTTNSITSRVSVSTAGTEGNNYSDTPVISPSGRYVAFRSIATNLVANDANGIGDVFVRDTVSSITSRVSVSTAGTEGNSASYEPAISSDGKYVAFTSSGSNLVANDSNAASDVFVRDTVSSITSRVSVSTAGTEGNGSSVSPSVSSDGRYVSFRSSATNLVADDTNGFYDVFVRDTIAGITSRVSVSTAGTESNGHNYVPSISPDGRYVAFRSNASNLVANDTNSRGDIFVHDRTTGITSRVSVSEAGVEGDGNCYSAAISSDGRYVVFESFSTNLIGGTTLSGLRHVFMAPRP